MTPLPTDPLALAILLYKAVRPADIRGRRVEGLLPAGLDFATIESALENASLLVSVDRPQRIVEFLLPNGFFESLEELISTSERRISPPDKFYLADCDYLHDGRGSTVPMSVQYYLEAARFYNLLGDAADYKGGIGSTKTLIFLQKEKLEIIPDYTVADLCELPKIDTLKNEFISSDTHKEQKLTIVRAVILDIFKGRAKVRFAELLWQFGDFIEKLNSSYQLYVSEFSFQKIKAEVEKEKLDATIKLNKVFSDIQNQLLAVPAALVLVGSQMERAGDWTSKNVTIWLGSLVFAILMTLLVRNQRHTLGAVKQEIDQQWSQIKGKHHSVADRFEDSYKQLNTRYRHQQRLIGIVSLLVAISFAVSTCMLLWFSIPKNLMIESLTWGVLFAAPLAAWDLFGWAVNKFTTW